MLAASSPRALKGEAKAARQALSSGSDADQEKVSNGHDPKNCPEAFPSGVCQPDDCPWGTEDIELWPESHPSASQEMQPD